MLLTYQWFRSRWFRIDSRHLDHHPHMVLVFDHNAERALEVSPAMTHPNEWLIWLRSDIAHRRCRFVFARCATCSEQIESMYAGLTDKKLKATNGYL